MKDNKVIVCFPVDAAFRFKGGGGATLPWSSPGSAAGGDAGSQKEGWEPSSPPGLVLPPWRPLNRRSKNIKPV